MGLEKTSRKRIQLTTVLAALVLTGCAAPAVDSEGPLSEVSASKWSATLNAATTVDPDSFWQAWHDADLMRLIERVDASSPRIESALATLRSARAQIRNADSALWPSANAKLDVARTRAAGAHSTSLGASLVADWTVNVAGAAYARYESALLTARAKAWSVQAVRNQLKAEVTTAYINLRAAQEKLALLKQLLKSYEQTAELARWNAEAGLGSQSDVESALAQVQSAKVQVLHMMQSIAEYRNALARLTALPNDALGIAVEGSLPKPSAGLATRIPAAVMMQRPDVRSALETLMAAARDVQAARADFFPTLSLTGSIGTEAATVSALGAAGTGVGTLAAALSSTLLNWGSLRAASEVAQAQFDAAKADYRETLVEALEETDNALWAVKTAESATEPLKQAVEHAARARDIARLEYQSGLGEYTALLLAERDYLSAWETEIDNRAAYSNAMGTLYRVLGGAWDVSDNAR